ncbi:MAG: twin-arginine translocation signal domain-containing protein, partial [Eggerthella lenta]
MTYALDRRKFIGGASVLAAAGMLGIMAGCSPNGQASAAKEEAKQQSAPDETREYDIAIVGAGAAGLAACVDAAQQGAKVVC